MVIHSEFWKDKTVFLTGHTGFKGSWLTIWLLEMGANVVGYSRDIPTHPSLFEEAGLHERIIHHTGDVENYKNLYKCINEAAPDVVIHMAAQALVRRSYATPRDTFATNVMGTVHVLETIRKIPEIKCGVIITSDKCYKTGERTVGFKETDPMEGYDPYSSSKGAAELTVSAYNQSYFNNTDQTISSARAGNVIGGGDWAEDRLVPDIVKAFTTGKTVAIRNHDAVRPWQHVLEPLSGYLVLAQKGFNGENVSGGWNFGPNEKDAKTVQWLVENMARYFKGDIAWKKDETDHLYESDYLKLDISKARSKLNWTPTWDSETAIMKTASWYMDFYSGSLGSSDNVYQRCVDDINLYSGKRVHD